MAGLLWGVVGHSAATGAYTRPTFGGSHGSRLLLGVESSNPPPPATPAPRGRSHQALTACLMASTTSWANNRATMSDGHCRRWSKWQELPRVGKVGSALGKGMLPIWDAAATRAPKKCPELPVRQAGGHQVTHLPNSDRLVLGSPVSAVLHKAHCWPTKRRLVLKNSESPSRV